MKMKFEVFSILIWFDFYSGMLGVGGYKLSPFRVTGIFEEPGTIWREAEYVAIATGWASIFLPSGS